MPKIKVYVLDGVTGKVVEDTADGTFASVEAEAEEFLREQEAELDIAQVKKMVRAKGGEFASETLTREQAAVAISLAVTDVIRAFRAFLDEVDVSETDREMLISEGREVVAEIGAQLDEVVNVLVGPSFNTLN